MDFRTSRGDFNARMCSCSRASNEHLSPWWEGTHTQCLAPEDDEGGTDERLTRVTLRCVPLNADRILSDAVFLMGGPSSAQDAVVELVEHLEG